MTGILTPARRRVYAPRPAAAPLPTFTQVASDNFTRADSSNLGTNWTTWFGTSLTIASNNAKGVLSTEHGDYRNAETYSNDQYSQVTLSAALSGNAGPGVRMAPGTNGTGYAFLPSAAGVPRIFRWSNTTVATQIATGLTGAVPGPGDVLKLAIEGNVMVGYINNVPVCYATDPNYTTGTPGAMMASTTTTFSAWSGGNASHLVTLPSLSGATITDNFNRADGSLVGTASWVLLPAGTATSTSPLISGNTCAMPVVSGIDAGAIWTSAPSSGDQYSQWVLAAPFPTDGFPHIGGLVRVNATSGVGYCGRVQHIPGDPITAPSYTIVRIDANNAVTTLAQTAGVAADATGTVFTLVAKGQHLYLARNGVVAVAWSDTTYTTGTIGVRGFGDASGPAVSLDNFAGGNV